MRAGGAPAVACWVSTANFDEAMLEKHSKSVSYDSLRELEFVGEGHHGAIPLRVAMQTEENPQLLERIEMVEEQSAHRVGYRGFTADAFR